MGESRVNRWVNQTLQPATLGVFAFIPLPLYMASLLWEFCLADFVTFVWQISPSTVYQRIAKFKWVTHGWRGVTQAQNHHTARDETTSTKGKSAQALPRY